ncbi:MAG: phosphatidylglycerol lysyltransferase domain-containing protein [Clostridiales bacterium]|nr:phosphatidylglycerol lysyltransferase domain-containing protein [Clostridiales bacterium]
MSEFVPLSSENICKLLPYFRSPASRACDSTIGAVYQWRKIYDTYVAELDGLLLIRADYEGFGEGYTYPLGEGDYAAALTCMETDARLRGMPFRLSVVPEDALPFLRKRYGNRMRAETHRDWADYIYDPQNFLAYAGKALHAQRNHVNRFRREHPFALASSVTPELLPACMEFLDAYVAESDPVDAGAAAETEGARDLLVLRKELGQMAYCIIEDGRVAALTIGEVAGDTLVVHVEKALKGFVGAYPAIAQALVRAAGEGIRFVNREDDAGDPGLRYSKTNYRPLYLLDKYAVTLSDGK